MTVAAQHCSYIEDTRPLGMQQRVFHIRETLHGQPRIAVNKAACHRTHLLVLDGVAHVEGVVLKGILGVDALAGVLILSLVLLSLLDHALDLILAQTALVVCDGDLVLLPCTEIAQGQLRLTHHWKKQRVRDTRNTKLH